MKYKEPLAIIAILITVLTYLFFNYGNTETSIVGKRAAFGNVRDDPYNEDILYLQNENSRIYFKKNRLFIQAKKSQCILFDVHITYLKLNEIRRTVRYEFKENLELDEHSCALRNNSEDIYRQP